MKNKLKTIFSSLILVILLTSIASSAVSPAIQNQNIQDTLDDSYVLGDADGNGLIEHADIEFLIAYIFSGGPAPTPLASGDFNQSGYIDIDDVVALITYLYGNQEPEDTQAPSIKLLNPDNDDIFKTTEDEKKITFEYKVSDASDIDYCELIIDDDVEKTDNTIEKDVKQKFTKYLDKGTYEWKIRCYDIHGNKAVSSEREFKIKEQTTSSNENQANQNQNNNEGSFYFEQQEVIDLTPETQETSKLNLSIGIILPIILALLVLTFFIIIIVIVASRKDY